MKKTTLSLISTIIFCGCSFSQDALYPALFTPESTTKQESAPVSEVKKEAMAPVTANPIKFEPIKVTSSSKTHTLVGEKVVSFRADLQSIQKNITANDAELKKIRDEVRQNSAQYHTSVAAIESKLQVGTTPGNPDVYAVLSTIQNNIQVMDSNSIALEQVSRRITEDADLATSLLDSIRSTYVVSGAVDEDHRQLRILENETAQTSILIQSVLSEINTDYARQAQYSQTAKSHIESLTKAVKVGNFSGAQAELPAYQAPQKAFAKPEYSGSSSSALMSISFANGTPRYKEALQTAVREALSIKPNATFDIVSINSVSPENGNAIFQELTNIGVNPSNINISGINDSSSGPSVQVFVK